MGLFRKLAKFVDAAVELADDSSEGIGPLADRPPVALREDASPLASLQALAAASAGRAGRAVVQWTDGVPGLAEGETGGGHCNVRMIVRSRELDGGFGPRVETHLLLPRDAGLLIGAGLEVPILRNPATGSIEKVDRGALVDELRPMFEAARDAEKARNRLGVGDATTAIKEGFADLGRPASPTEPDPTVDGVTADQWLAARRVVAVGRIPAAVLDRTLAAYGIPAGRWPAIDAAWSARAATDPVLAARLSKL